VGGPKNRLSHILFAMGVIYKIESPTGRIYVGQTKHLRQRIACYKFNYTRNKFSSGHNKLYNSLGKYGFENHKFSIIEEVDDSILYEREKYWIKELNTYCFDNPKHLNMSRGGEGGGRTWMFDVERRKRQSELFKGENGTFYGKKHTEATKLIIAQKNSEYNKKHNIRVPKWGAEKGRLKVIVSVLCYDKYGNFLKEYVSATDASKELKINRIQIIRNCRNKAIGVGGKYVFRYKEPNFPLKINVGEVKPQNIKRPVLYLDKNHNIIKEYESAFEASIDLNVPKTTINRAALRKDIRPIRKGHIFLYKDLYLCSESSKII
jgi:group I intron endonuclease